MDTESDEVQYLRTENNKYKTDHTLDLQVLIDNETDFSNKQEYEQLIQNKNNGQDATQIQSRNQKISNKLYNIVKDYVNLDEYEISLHCYFISKIKNININSNVKNIYLDIKNKIKNNIKINYKNYSLPNEYNEQHDYIVHYTAFIESISSKDYVAYDLVNENNIPNEKTRNNFLINGIDIYIFRKSIYGIEAEFFIVYDII